METPNWPDLAEAFAQLIPKESLDSKVCEFLEAEKDQPWAIACSGGADSLSLLLLIYGHFKEVREQLHVFHFNHNLRSEESDQEEAFVQNVANSLGLKFFVSKGNEEDSKSEAHLRTVRHSFFKEKLTEIGSNILILGHQQDDVAETMLMRIARGSGTSGLCAPRPISSFRDGRVHLRPLIHLSKKLLLEKLLEAGIPWCEDSSNEGEYYFRNRIRRNVIPEWEAASVSDLWKGVGRSRELLEEDDAALNQWLVTILGEKMPQKGQPLEVDLLSGVPKALYRRALHEWLYVNLLNESLTSASFSSLLNKLINQEPTRVSIGDQFLVYKQGKLVLEDDESEVCWDEVLIELGKTVQFPNSYAIIAEKITLSLDLKEMIFSGSIDNNKEAYLIYDEDGEKPEFYARSWAKGDRYKPLGSPGSRKLQDMFTDKKIDVRQRRSLPIIYEKTAGIVWCPGFPIAENMKIKNTTQRALKLTYHKIKG